ncbi:agmatinase [Thalassotalea eurytherma]|uniref:Agmatinase n=1 Tax=Thalassotalea eurytherma TaxID=1144278 RepID=A0ABQ6H0K5_9GAMM|nr:agmatinase [Thalassotalea eurytherma]GLX81127.1 agmatinase [Thalassotalea eurytherma]
MNASTNSLKNINIKLQPAQTPFECSQTTDTIHTHSVHLIGFGFDGTACFRKGTKAGPNALREVSDGIESYSPYLDLDLEGVDFYDLGNLSTDIDTKLIEQANEHKIIEAQWQKATDDFCALFSDVDLKTHQVKVLTLGGEHSISYAPLKTYLEQYPDLVVLHLDAHADLRDGYLNFYYSHASIIRRALDHFGPEHQLIQYGIRSGTKDEYQWMKANQTLKQSREEFLAAVDDIEPTQPVYLTFDLDYFDPSFFPGTGTPEPGGEDFHSFVSLCKILRNKQFVGCDVVELSPEIDSTGNSDVFAAKVVRELILCLNQCD